jgi:hypothetical protein
MKPEIKQAWLTALRSGEYQQGMHQLRNVNNTYCCYGVLCDLYHKAHPQTSRWMNVDWAFVVDTPSYLEMGTTMPPQTVYLWSGLVTDFMDSFMIHKKVGPLSHMNDNGKSFEEIAQHIEETY